MPPMKPPGAFVRVILALWHAPGRTWAGALMAANITLWWRCGAAFASTALFALVIWIFWKAPFWPAAAWAVRADWLGSFGLSAAFLMLVCIVALMDFRLNMSVSRSGLNASMAGDHDEPPPPVAQVTTTTTTEITAPAPVAEAETKSPPWEAPK